MSLFSRSLIPLLSSLLTGDTETAPQLPKPKNGLSGRSMKAGGESWSRVLLCDFCCFPFARCSKVSRVVAFVDVKYRDISASVSAALVDLRRDFMVEDLLFARAAGSSGLIRRELRKFISLKARSGT